VFCSQGQGEYREIERSALLQMCGRAGRPQFDTAGVAVIMTQRHTRAAYEGLVHGTKPIESNLGLAMPEHVNAEIASGIITDKETAMDWLKHSFFYIRVTQNPRHYGVVAGKTPDVACGEMVAENLRKISSAQMCEIGEDTALPRGNFIKPLEGGRVMSDMYIRFETMKRIMSVQSPASVPDLLMTLCESDELSSIKLRRDEKVLLKGWNLSKDEPAIVRFKVTEIRGKAGKVAVAKTVKTAAQKIYIIAQETMSDQFATVLPPSMRMEVENVFQNGRRIMQGAARYFANVSKEGNFAAYCNALRLAKALDMRMWVRTSSSFNPSCGSYSQSSFPGRHDLPHAADSQVRQKIRAGARRSRTQVAGPGLGPGPTSAGARRQQGVPARKPPPRRHTIAPLRHGPPHRARERRSRRRRHRRSHFQRLRSPFRRGGGGGHGVQPQVDRAPHRRHHVER
jgi:ATP-dependent DNA helicase HFM1/MER3